MRFRYKYIYNQYIITGINMRSACSRSRMSLRSIRERYYKIYKYYKRDIIKYINMRSACSRSRMSLRSICVCRSSSSPRSRAARSSSSLLRSFACCALYIYIYIYSVCASNTGLSSRDVTSPGPTRMSDSDERLG